MSAPVKERFVFVARQQAPQNLTVKVEAVRPTPNTVSGYLVTLDCLHIVELVPHFTYTIGVTRVRCYECGKLRTRDLPEFAGHDFSEAALSAVMEVANG